MATHPWAAEASRLVPANLRRVARDGVRIQWAKDGGLVASLATNPRLRRWDVSQADGVERNDPEVGIAERAITARVLSELVAHDTMRAWIGREARYRGGNAGLVDALMGMQRMPAGYGGKDGRKRYRASLLRAIQRSGPAKKAGREEEHGGITRRDYLARINRLRGGPQRGAYAIIDDARLHIGVRGDWWYQEELLYEFERKDVPREWESGDGPVHQVLLKGGEGFADTVKDLFFASEAIELRKVYALYVEVKLG